MNNFGAFIVMLIAVTPLPLVFRIQRQQPLEFSPDFIGEFIGLSGGVMFIGIVIGGILWIPARAVMGPEKVPAIRYFFASATVAIAMFFLIGNVGCITSPNQCS